MRIKVRLRFAAFAGLATLIAPLTAAFAQGRLTPPGGPARGSDLCFGD